MGYYDDHRPNRNQQRSGKRSSFFTGLIGGIIGALLVAMIYPAIFSGGTEKAKPNRATVEQNRGDQDNNLTKNISLDVNTDTTEAVAKASKGVVGITNIQAANFWSTSPSEGGVGSGVIYKKAGDQAYIVTNHHVIEGASELEVTLSDGTKIPAKIRGSDVWTDLAVIEVAANEIKDEFITEFGDSDALKIGEPVMAIGNPLGLQFSGSVTQGIVSGVNRTVPVDINKDGIPDWHAEVIQTDAAINPGNSGGALINIAGQVIGINSMKIAQHSVEGIGFSIPINYVIPIIEDLEDYGEVKRPAMGVTLRNVEEIPAYHQQETLKLPKEVKDGIMIEQTVPNSPAEKAGLQELDVIIKLDDEEVTNVVELRKYLYNKKTVGDSMNVTYYREGKEQTVTVKLTDETRM